MKELEQRQYEGFKVITTGHWVFAIIFVIVFIGVIIWASKKDRFVFKNYYNKNIYFILGVIVVLFLLFVFRQYLR